MIKFKLNNLKSKIVLFTIILLSSCNPEAPWSTKLVRIQMQVENLSAGFAECSVATNKEAYYLVGITYSGGKLDPATEDQLFMQQALDSAYKDYQEWRQGLEAQDISPIAPFSSHSLLYGSTTRFFTGLLPDTEYWIYAFVVNPDKLTPAGQLYIEKIRTLEDSKMNVHFDYRVKGYWDYIYPINEDGSIEERFPYVATTRDSLDIASDEHKFSPEIYFDVWLFSYFMAANYAPLLYGVKAIYNDGFNSFLEFQPGHTYYTCISGFDGSFRQMYLYKFTWTGEDFEAYFSNEDNLSSNGQNQ